MIRNESSALASHPRALLVIILVLAAALSSGCSLLGTCWTECTTDSGGLNVHGPWEDYTEAECEEAAEIETTIMQTCVADWEAY